VCWAVSIAGESASPQNWKEMFRLKTADLNEKHPEFHLHIADLNEKHPEFHLNIICVPDTRQKP
jgi:hypothetical protein